MRFGILGGAGPLATAELLTLTLKTAARYHGAEQDSDFPDIITTSIGIPAGDETAKFAPEETTAHISEGLALLDTCDYIAVACNTISTHPLLKEDPRVIDNIAVTKKRIRTENSILLASEQSVEQNLWDMSTVPAEQQKLVTQAIFSAMRGRPSFPMPLVSYLAELPAQNTIVLGCTELTYFAERLPFLTPHRIIDSTQSIASEIVRLNYMKRD